MKKLPYIIFAFLSLPVLAFAINPVNVDRPTGGGHIEPLIKTDYIQAPYFTATSTSATSTLPIIRTNTIDMPLLNTANNGLLMTVTGVDPAFGQGMYSFLNQYESPSALDGGKPSNLYLGRCAGTNNCSLSGIGNSAFNTAVGQYSMSALAGGIQNTAFGFDALGSLTTGIDNTAIGNSAGLFLTTGSRNTIFGSFAGSGLSSGSDNILIGKYAGSSGSTGSRNIYMGTESGTSNNGSGNIFLGFNSGTFALGESNKLVIANSATGNNLTLGNPLILGDFAAASTTIFGSFNIATSTATSTSLTGWNISSGCYALNGTCISGGSSSGAAYPFTPTTNYAVTNQATTGIMWAQAGINASSTSHFVYASSTAISATSLYASALNVTGGINMNNSDINNVGIITAVGGTPAISLGDQQIYNFGGDIIIDWGLGTLTQPGTLTKSVDWNNRQLDDSSGNPALDWSSHGTFLVSALAGSGTKCVHTNNGGSLSVAAADCATGGSAYPFTTLTNFGVANSATTTPLWAQAGINASSTSHFVYASSTSITASNSLLVGSPTRNMRIVTPSLYGTGSQLIDKETGGVLTFSTDNGGMVSMQPTSDPNTGINLTYGGGTGTNLDRFGMNAGAGGAQLVGTGDNLLYLNNINTMTLGGTSYANEFTFNETDPAYGGPALIVGNGDHASSVIKFNYADDGSGGSFMWTRAGVDQFSFDGNSNGGDANGQQFGLYDRIGAYGYWLTSTPLNTTINTNLYVNSGITSLDGGNIFTNGSGNLTVVSCTGCGVSSQWTTLGSNIYYTTGNVGVGTTTPAEKLDVNGRLLLEPTTAPTAVYKGTQWNDSVSNQQAYTNGNTLYNGSHLYTATSSVTLNSTSPTSAFSANKLGTTTIAANSLRTGQHFTIWGAGYYSTPLGNTATVTITPSVASSTVTNISTVTTAIFPASASNLPYDFRLNCTVQAIGTAAKIVCDGTFNYATALTGVSPTSNSLSTVGQITFDSTVRETLDVKVNWSAVTTQTATVQESWIDF